MVAFEIELPTALDLLSSGEFEASVEMEVTISMLLLTNYSFFKFVFGSDEL